MTQTTVDFCLHFKGHTGALNCLSLCIVSSGGIRFGAGRLEKNISLILFADVPNQRKPLTNHLAPNGEFLEILILSDRTEKKH